VELYSFNEKYQTIIGVHMEQGRSDIGTTGRIHVMSSNDRWAIKRDGASRASRVFRKKATAVKNARKIASKTLLDIIIHKRDGSVEKWIKSKTIDEDAKK
jgi:hypothetical protein